MRRTSVVYPTPAATDRSQSLAAGRRRRLPTVGGGGSRGRRDGRRPRRSRHRDCRGSDHQRRVVGVASASAGLAGPVLGRDAATNNAARTDTDSAPTRRTASMPRRAAPPRRAVASRAVARRAASTCRKWMTKARWGGDAGLRILRRHPHSPCRLHLRKLGHDGGVRRVHVSLIDDPVAMRRCSVCRCGTACRRPAQRRRRCRDAATWAPPWRGVAPKIVLEGIFRKLEN